MSSRKYVRKQRSSSGLPRTSRVNDEIVQYYEKYAQQRDIVKFMRLYSSSSSNKTSGTSATASSLSSMSDVDGKALKLLFQTEVEKYKASKSTSLPNIINNSKKEIIVPITMETSSASMGKENVITYNQDFKTPTKPKAAKDTKTPESITKSHRRLEWDSLGDVGYKKSMSTSNISLLERSVLKEVIQELSTSSLKVNTNSSEGDLKKLNDYEQAESKMKSKSHEHNLNTPLASSTLLDTKSKRNSTGARPKQKNVSTSTSLQTFLQKSTQTSIHRQPLQPSQETNDNTAVIGSTTTTPTSFEYQTSRSTEEKIISRRNKDMLAAKLAEMIEQRLEKSPKTNKETDLSNDNDKEVAEIQNTLKLLLDDSKENASLSNTSLTHSPQLDLGIQLLCSLIEAKRLNSKQKKMLLRSIVSRIIAMSSESIDKQVKNANTKEKETVPLVVSKTSSSAKVEDKPPLITRKSSSQIKLLKTAKLFKNHPPEKTYSEKSSTSETLSTNDTNQASNSSSAEDEKVIHVEVYNAPSNTSVEKVKSTESTAKPTTDANNVKSDTKNENQFDKTDNTVPKVIESAINKAVDNVETENENKNSLLDSENVTNTTVSSTHSKDMIAPTAANNLNDTNADGDQTTMREWLNPLTQSEIEYEEKKRELAQKQEMEEKEKQKKQILNMNKERKQQLNWIDTEIERLEGLRYLLLKQNSLLKDSEKDKAETLSQTKENNEKVYDTVYTAPESSSMLSAGEIQQVDVILQHSNEAVIKKKEKLKYTRDRLRETQIIYDKPNTVESYGLKVPGKPLYRTIKETTKTQIEQVSSSQSSSGSKNDKVLVQRSKINTPVSIETETVGSFVQQRKREFLENYNNKKKTHYESLLQQQRLQQKQLKRQKQYENKQLQQPSSNIDSTQNYSEYYSVPHTVGNKFIQQNKPKRKEIIPTHTIAKESNSSTSMAGATSETYDYQQNPSTEYSTSSILIASSEVSVPMGSNNESSPTTTHQYDAVAGTIPSTTIGVQTSNSLKTANASRPARTQTSNQKTITNIPCQFRVPCQLKAPHQCCCAHYNSHAQNYRLAPHSPHQVSYRPPPVMHSFGVQVKPKPIAYVITFDNNDETSTAQTSNDLTVPDEQPQLTLQDYLYRARPTFFQRSKQREAILNEIQTLRQERERELRDIVENNSFNTMEKKLKRLPPPPTRKLRIFQTKEMKAMTKKRFAKLSEVVEKQEREREERRRRGNRLLRDVFNRRLQRHVRNGKISLNHSKTVI